MARHSAGLPRQGSEQDVPIIERGKVGVVAIGSMAEAIARAIDGRRRSPTMCGMEQWREKASEMLPELTSRIEAADSTYDLWIDLRLAFEDAYEQSPPGYSLIRRIYQYSDWCCDQPRGETADDDLLTCVAVCFFEHIPVHQKARTDMPRWWRSEDLATGPSGERSVLGWNLSAEQIEELKTFLDRERDRYDPTLW